MLRAGESRGILSLIQLLRTQDSYDEHEAQGVGVFRDYFRLTSGQKDELSVHGELQGPLIALWLEKNAGCFRFDATTGKFYLPELAGPQQAHGE